MNWEAADLQQGGIEMAKRTFAYGCSLASLTAILVASVSLPSLAPAQTRGPTDPGVRGGAAGAGDPITGLTAEEGAFFKAATVVFGETEVVADGLGPRFNLDSCGGCHIQPKLGGTSPSVNPQVAVAQRDKNTVPSFITANGPVREARFVRNPDGTPDGGVHALFVITGRQDAGGCNIQQPNFAAAVANNNVVFRIPTPTFGLGLVESTTDAALRASMAANSQQKRSLGISGRFNTNGNDGTITRFGWKAQNKSLEIFAGEAYNVEQGVTNELFGNPRSNDPACLFNKDPEDATNITPDMGAGAAEFSGDAVQFAMFMRLSAPPTPGPATDGTRNGAGLFDQIGCTACHSVTLTTGQSRYSGMSGVDYHPYSDFALHHMGQGLDDGIQQGGAATDQFRTSPLWGVGQRLFFLHDGRTKDLGEAIEAHASVGSEANVVLANFNKLTAAQQGDLLAFLRSL